jgi:hypothetical protein
VDEGVKFRKQIFTEGFKNRFIRQGGIAMGYGGRGKEAAKATDRACTVEFHGYRGFGLLLHDGTLSFQRSAGLAFSMIP